MNHPMYRIGIDVGGFGALQGLDGASTLPGPSNMACVPVEVWESRTGVTVESKRLRIDSGGAGAWRGGLGQEVVLRNDSTHPLTVFSMANRTEFAAQGLAGGQAGALREHRLNGVRVDPKGRLELAPGDRLIMLEAGGGGIGDPANRPAAQVASDVRAGYVSLSEAARRYRQPLPPVRPSQGWATE